MEKTNQIIYKEIKDLFEARDKAIETRDRELMKSTQLDTLRVSVPKYIKFSSAIISLAVKGENELTKVAFIKEQYIYKDYGDGPDDEVEITQERFRIYHLINTALGWKIFRDY